MSLHAHSSTTATKSGHLERRIGLRSAVLFNMLEMIGVGPFITLPLVIAAAGYRLSVWAWILGAVIAVADGLVWAELGAAFPRAGGSYAFLREIYGPDRAGNWLSFLYVWQLSFSAPLSIASGFAHAAATGGWHMPPSPAQSAAAAVGGLAQATLIATYDYWGYYNITFLGSEVKQPEKTIPRAILLSVLFVATLYVVMNLSA